jgi:tetratricopeptide (TPR) repeat protein
MNFTVKNKQQYGVNSKAPAAKISQHFKYKKRFLIIIIFFLPLIILTLFVAGLITPDYDVIHNGLFQLQPHKLFAGFNENKDCIQAGNENTVQISRPLIMDRKGVRVESHLDNGDEFYKRNQIDQALKEYKAAHAIEPVIQTYNRIGLAYLRKTEIAYRIKRDYDEALDSFNKGLYYFNQGLLHWPDDMELNYNIGLLYSLRNDGTESAMKHFQKVLQINPEQKKVLHSLSQIYLRLSEFEKARSCLFKAIKLDSLKYVYYTDLGIIYMRENKYNEATKWLTKAVDMNNDLKAKYLLLQVRAQLNKNVDN